MLGPDRNASQLGTKGLRLVVLLVCAVGAACSPPQHYDLVINSGRVIDPETKLDAVRSVGIIGDRIAKVSAQPLEGSKVIDATGLVVSPGLSIGMKHVLVRGTPVVRDGQVVDGATPGKAITADLPAKP